jgi:5'-nucleotidase
VVTDANGATLNSLPMTTISTCIPRPDWSSIDIVLLDMDGTLLDLRFDNHFWLEAVPERYAQLHQISVDRAREVLNPRFAAKQGTLDWYCIDFWTQELSLDIAELKRELRENVRFLPGAETFLQALKGRGVRAALVTNAHDQSLAVKAKQTDLTRYFDHVISSHRYGYPKENPQFWVCLQKELGFEPARAMFVDDSPSVLRAAHRFGIGQIFAITHPDSTQEGRVIEEFPAIRAVIDLISEEMSLGEHAEHAKFGESSD